MADLITQAKDDAFDEIIQERGLDMYEIMAREFLHKIPCYYDENNNIFLYHKNQLKWLKSDKTDLVNIGKHILKKSGLNESKNRASFMNAVLDMARWKKPEEISEKWIQFDDYFYDLDTDERIRVDKKYFNQIKIPHKLGESEETPIIDAKIKSWVGEEQYKLFVQICAYCMYKAYPFARFFIFYGTGSDGKSTAGDFISNLVGIENSCNVDLDQLSTKQFEAQKLYQKTFAVCGEVDYRLLKDTRRLKAITGNDPISIEFKGKNAFSYKNFAKLLWYANGLPPTYDKTDGFYRRATVLKFPNKFSECVDPLADIPEEEYENFCYKCMIYLKDLLKNCFDEKSLEEKKKEYEELSNPVMKFFSECVKEEETSELLMIGTLYEEYQKYAKKNAFRNFSYREFLTMVNNLDDIEVEKKMVYLDENEGKAYRTSSHISGVKLRRMKSFINNHSFCTPCSPCTANFKSESYIGIQPETGCTSYTCCTTKAKKEYLTSEIFDLIVKSGEEISLDFISRYDNEQEGKDLINLYLTKGKLIEKTPGKYIKS